MKGTEKQPVIDSTSASTGNADYRDSGIAWLGRIPSHWHVARMRHVSQAISGGTPSKENPDYWNGDIPWVSPKDMKRRVIDSAEDTITHAAVAETGLKTIDPGSLLIVVRGMILAHSFPVAITSVPVTINQDMKAVRFHVDVDPKFAAWYLTGVGQYILASIVEEAGHGTRVIRMDEWKSASIPVPPLVEQRAIIRFLEAETEAIDRVIATHSMMITELEAQHLARVTRVVTRGLDGTSAVKDSGDPILGQITQHWGASKLKYVLAAPLKYGANEAAELVDRELPRYVRITDITDAGTLREETFRSLPTEIAEEYQLQSGDLLFARSGATAGKTFLYHESWGECAYAGYLVRARFDKRRILPDFAKYYTTSLTYWTWLSSEEIQATIPNVSAEKYANLTVPLPPLAEQTAIVEALDRYSDETRQLIVNVRSAIASLRELRASLISSAVTGKLDLRTRTS